MAESPVGPNQVGLRLKTGQTYIAQQCSYYESDGTTSMTGVYESSSNRMVLTPAVDTVTANTIYVEYNSVRHIWSGWSLGQTYELDISTLPTDISIDRIELPNGDTVKLHDARISTLNYAGSPSAGGPANKTMAIPYGEVANTSTATAFTATVDGITELKDGVCVLLKNGVVTSASGFTININNLGAKPAFNNMTAATRETTIFNVNYTMLFVYDSTRVVDGITGAWCCYRGYDANTNTIGYQVRTNSYSLPMSSITYRYRILFTSADGSHFVPANNSTSTNATASRTVCQDKIDPFGKIVYYGTTASVAAGSRPSATNLWLIYAFALGYSFNRTGAALTLTLWKPVYVKCAPQSDGSAIIDSTTPYVQDLPTTDDGKIYILLGVAYSATNIELLDVHPVYYYKDGQIRLWTNATASGGVTDVTVGGTSVVSNGVAAISVLSNNDIDTIWNTAMA